MTAAPRIAIVHDWFQGYHGSERVVDALREGLATGGSGPAVFTFHAAREVLPPGLAAAIAVESRLARLPLLRQRGHDPGRWRYLLPYMPLYFRRLDLEAFDVVVSSSHAFAHHVRPPADALHVCYCHTPMRYAWLPSLDARAGLAHAALRLARPALRRLDRRAARRVDGFVANSSAVRERIRRFYDRDAVVIHPPVDVDEFDCRRPKRPGHFLWVGRLVGYKRPLEVAEAFRHLSATLTMVGIGPEEERLRRMLPPNVTLHAWLERSALVRQFEEASGFVHVAEEDFGIGTVEALAAGTPVVALGAGGALDIVRPDVDGVLVEAATPAAIAEGVTRVAARSWSPHELASRAGAFSRERFVERFSAHLGELGVPLGGAAGDRAAARTSPARA